MPLAPFTRATGRLAGVLAVVTATSAAGLNAQSPPATARQAEQARRIDSLATDAVQAGRLASVSVAVVQSNDTVVLRAWGAASRETKRAADRGTVYRLGSITKQFTSAIVLQLVAEHRLALTDTLGGLLPWVPALWRPVTIAQLLNHTSGIPSYTSLGAPWIKRWAEDMTPDTIIALTAQRPLDFAPGSNWRYDNTGYVILGRIIELVEHRRYAESVQARLAAPFSLTSLRYCPTDPAAPNDAAGYASAPNHTFTPAARLSLSQPFAAGGLCANAIDIVRWNRALHGGRVVSPSMYVRMTTPEGAAVASHYGYGIGRSDTGRLQLAHGGGINGFATSNSYWPDSALSIVVFSNTEGNQVDALAEQIRRVVAGEALVKRPKPITLTPAQLRAYAGRYELALAGRAIALTVRLTGTRLTATFEGDTPTTLVPIGAHRFMADNDEQTQLLFDLVGKVAQSLTFESGPQRFTGRRIGDAP